MDQASIGIIGAGYGGSIMAARLAQALQGGRHRIVVLEKGNDLHWKGPGDHLFDPKSTYKQQNEFNTGFLQSQDPTYQSQIYHFYQDQNDLLKPSMRIAAGKGIGGGSLINGAASMRAPTDSFEQMDDTGRRRWPKAFTRKFLDPYYKKVEDFLHVQQLYWKKGSGHPDWAIATRRDYVFAQGCLKAGFSAQPIRVALGDCRNCGWCYTGCAFDSKLAMNYPKLARSLGVQFYTQCDVQWIAPAGARGYVVTYRDNRSGGTKRELECQMVILAAGSVGTSSILLRSQALGHFPGNRTLGEQVGRNLSSAGDHFLGGIVDKKYTLNNFEGKVVNAATLAFWEQYRSLSASEKPKNEHLRFVIESFSLQPWLTIWGLPAQLSKADKPGATGRNSINPTTPLWGKAFKDVLDNHATRVMSTLVLGVDQAEGHVKLRPAAVTGPAGQAIPVKELVRNGLAVPSVEWPKTHPKTEAMWAAAVGKSKLIYEALGGEILADTYRDNGIVTAPHAVGGCVMADSIKHGVVDDRGQLFNNPNLFIADGSMMPPIGINPYLSIAAVAERNAELLQKELATRLV